jgi:O-antigen/teichoic acid export membrane protein
VPDVTQESIRRNAAFALAIRVSGAILTGGLTLFLVRYLGPEDYGVFALALSIGGLLLLPSDFGISQSTARFVAEHRDDQRAVGDLLGNALSLKALGAGFVSAALVVAAGPIASAYGITELEWPLRLMAVALLGQSFITLFAATFEALGRNSIRFRMTLSETLLEVGASLALVLAGAGVAGATLGRAIGYSLGALLGIVLLARLIDRASVRSGLRRWRHSRRIAGYAGALFVIDASWALFSHLDTLMIGGFLGAREAGLFSAPAYLLVPASFVGLALAGGVAPRLARRGREAPDPDALQRALRYLIVFQLLLVPAFLVWAEPIATLLLGAEYEESAAVFRGLAPYVIVSGIAPLLAISVNYLGEARRRLPLGIAAVAINALINVILIPKIGIIAGAIGTSVASLVYVTGHLRICHSLVPLDLRALAATFLRALLAATAMAAALFAFGTSQLEVAEWIGGGLAGGLAYGATILLTREFSADELSSARGAVSRLMRRLRRAGG